MVTEDEVYKIGTITRTHGVRGELAFLFTDDVWDSIDADYLFLRLDGLLVPFFLEEWRFRSDTLALVKFEDIDTADAAQPLVGADVCFPKALTPELPDDAALTWRHFVGFEVRQEASADDEGASSAASTLGTVAAVMDQTENVLLDVLTPDNRSLLIPAHEDFVLRADHKERVLYVHVPDELLTLNL